MNAQLDPTQGHLGYLGFESNQPPDAADGASRLYLSGVQALVQLPMMQRVRDRAAGLDTAGFVSGYRGSPLGNLDQALQRARSRLEEHHVRFQPGLNEDLAATAVWGSQQTGLFSGARYDGVFGLWYAKGPGVDRSLDVLKHANAAGTAPHGGVLAVAGDDHGAKSSSLPHQSEHVFAAAMIPVLNPAGVQEYLDFGIHGWAMSRFSGCWVGMKAVADTVESAQSVIVDPFRVEIQLPDALDLPPGGPSIRWPDPPMSQELRLQRHKVYAAMAYARANHLDRVVVDSPRARLGIITTGKAFLDVCQAFDDLGIEPRLAAEIGLRVYKVGLSWPLDAEGVRHFAEGLEEILVVEEKRQLIEYQLKEQLYNWREDVRPRVTGKYDEKGEWELPHGGWQLPAAGELAPAGIARVIARRIERFHTSERIKRRLAFLDEKERSLANSASAMERVPHYCSGCPHNSSTHVPEGSRALAGIGCHYMALWLHPETTKTFTQMGGEGTSWIGQAPFTDTPHVFANLGDGTYFHSGLLAIRAAVAAGVNITYKVLFNDAVAMTGGQKMETAGLSVPRIARQLEAEGVSRLVVVTDEPARYGTSVGLPQGVPVHHRRELDAVQRALREHKGVSAIIYDQTCAAEKRRRRKKGEYPDPARRIMINDRVCEGCGDCSRASNCMSVVPVETEWGRKRAIDQSSCNKDYSCVEGFCPSFVSVEGGRLRKGRALATADTAFPELPEPRLPPLEAPYNILVTGVGGTGVVTIGAILGMAAHLEHKGVSVLDMAGLAQKGGAVWSHIRLAGRPDILYATRIAAGEADLVLGCDIVVAVGAESVTKMQAGLTRAVVNSDFSITSDFVRTFAAQAQSGDLTRYRDPIFPLTAMEDQVVDAVGSGQAEFLAATRLSTALLGDFIATNLFMVGYAWQKGLIPLSEPAIMQAIAANKVEVELNQASFLWGRRAAHDLAAVERIAAPAEDTAPESHRLSESLEELIARRVKELTAYQDAAYANRYAKLVERVRQAEAAALPGETRLTRAVARCHYKLLAYKDEYEVARFYTDGEFLKRVHATFEGDYKLTFHLAPPITARRDPATGVSTKRSYGPWMLRAFGLLARLKRLRGTPFDIFGYTADRRLERRLLAEYERTLEQLLGSLNPRNHEAAVQIASVPDLIRGFGHVKERHVANAKRREAELLKTFSSGNEPGPKAGGGVKRTTVAMAG